MLGEVTKVSLKNIKKTIVDCFHVKDNALFDNAQMVQCGMEFVNTPQLSCFTSAQD